MLCGTTLAFGNCSVEHRLQLVFRDNVAVIECIDTRRQGPVSGDQLFQIGQKRVIMRKRLEIGNGRKLSLGFIIEPELLSLQHLETRSRRDQHSPQRNGPATFGVVLDGRQSLIDFHGQRTRVGQQGIKTPRVSLRRLLQGGRAIIGIDIFRLMRAGFQC